MPVLTLNKRSQKRVLRLAGLANDLGVTARGLELALEGLALHTPEETFADCGIDHEYEIEDHLQEIDKLVTKLHLLFDRLHTGLGR